MKNPYEWVRKTSKPKLEDRPKPSPSLVPDSVKGTGFFTPMDLPPPDSVMGYPALKNAILARLEEDWGPRCESKDYEDFPELDPLFAVGDPDLGRCPACLVYEKFDKFWSYFDHSDDV